MLTGAFLVLVGTLVCAYSVKAIYLADLQHRNPALTDLFDRSFWEPTTAAFWITFIVILVLLLALWVLMHQCCNCFRTCRQSEPDTTPEFWRRYQASTPASRADFERLRRVESGVGDIEMDDEDKRDAHFEKLALDEYVGKK